MKTFKVATFNIRHGLGTDGRLSLERTGRVILGTEASFVGVQEIDRFWSRSGGVDQAAALADLTGMHMSFHPTFTKGGGDYGLGLLSCPPIETSFEKLPRRAREEPRGVIIGRTPHFTLLVTHLSSDPAARPEQVETLLEIAEKVSPPVVVMGDFNETLRGLRAFAEAGFSPGRRRVTTFPRLGWGRQIDFVFAGRGAEVAATGTVKTAASDHLPLRADVLTQ